MSKLAMTVVTCLLALGCSTYGIQEDGGVDAGADAGQDAELDADVDAGSDADSDADSDSGLCQAEPPQRFHLKIGEGPWFNIDCPAVVNGPAQVLYAHPAPEDDFNSVLWLWLIEDACLAKIFLRFPEGHEAPLRLGETLWASVMLEETWWVNQDLEIREDGPSGPLRLHVAHTSFYDLDFIPDCEPTPDDRGCGNVAFPSIHVQPDDLVSELSLKQGGSAYVQAADKSRAYQVFVGDLYQYIGHKCYELWAGWLSLAEIDLSRYSQPSCTNDEQCAPVDFCDPTSAHCLPNRCLDTTCPSGEVCDPYQGLCDAEPSEPCQGAADCSISEVCNTRTGLCVQDICQVMDCLGSCSSLLGGCYQCLHDADCWPGLCDADSHICQAECKTEKIDFNQDNPQHFERFTICVDNRFENAAELLDKYAVPATCTTPAAPSACDGSLEQTCQGELTLNGPNGHLNQEQWFGLCALTRLDGIHRIQGSHYLP